MTDEEVRPRFGSIIHEDKSETPIYFVPRTENEFVAMDAKTDEPVNITPSDILKVDVVGPGQSIIINSGGSGKRVQPTSNWRSERSEINQKFRDIISDIDNKEAIMAENENRKKYSAGQAVGILLGLFAGVVGVAVLGLAGFRWALSL